MLWMLTALIVSETGPLVLDQGEVAKRAAVASTAGLRGDAEVEAAKARAAGLDLRFYPRVGLTARYTRISEEDPAVIDPGIPGITVSLPGAKPDQWFFGVSVGLPVSDWFLRAGDLSEAGARGVAAATWKVESERRRAQLEAVLVYWSLVRVSEAEKVATQSIVDARQRLEETKKRVAAQVASPADLRLAEARMAEVEGAQASLGHARALVAMQLRRLLDLPNDTVITTSDTAGAAPEDGELGAMVAEAWATRPEPKALREAEAALLVELGLQDVQRLPRFDVVANAQVVNPNPRAFPQSDEFVPTWDVSAVVSWNVDALWTTRPGEDEVRAKMRSLAADRAALDDGIHLEIAAAQQALRDADTRARTSQAMLAAAEEGHRVRTKLYALGQATTLEVAEAETQLERARLGVVDARIERRIGEARLSYALGRAL